MNLPIQLMMMMMIMMMMTMMMMMIMMMMIIMMIMMVVTQQNSNIAVNYEIYSLYAFTNTYRLGFVEGNEYKNIKMTDIPF
jgi:hypothetical protein